MVVLGAVAVVASIVALVAVILLVRRMRHASSQLDAVASRLEVLEEEDRPAGTSAPAPAPAASGNALTDEDTGLFSEEYFGVALDARLSAARRHLRPVAVVLIDVVEGLAEGAPAASDPAVVAASISATIRDADTACRMSDGRFGLVLEDTPENGAIWTVERIRRHLAGTAEGHTLWAGVACYPAHAFDAAEILTQAEAALTAAREWRQDRIEVATAP
jgi:two-component system cell cycle response regulator